MLNTDYASLSWSCKSLGRTYSSRIKIHTCVILNADNSKDIAVFIKPTILS